MDKLSLWQKTPFRATRRKWKFLTKNRPWFKKMKKRRKTMWKAKAGQNWLKKHRISSKNDLKKLINRRLSYFSSEKNNDYKTIFASDVSEEDIDMIFEISNSNPRDIIHIFKTLFEEPIFNWS